MNLTRERIRQVEVKALAKLEALQDMYALRDYVEEGPVGKRRLPTLSKEELSGKGKAKVKAKVEAAVELEDEDEDEDEFDKDDDFDSDELEATEAVEAEAV